ncbi:MAG: hypothetical protein U0269_36235 [Polyangiales bacterium]
MTALPQAPRGLVRYAVPLVLAVLAVLVVRVSRGPERRPQSIERRVAPTRVARIGVDRADPLAGGAREGGPRRVYVGVYAFHVPQLDLSANAYLVDFWLWFRWKGEDIDPSKSFEFMNQFEAWDVMKLPVYADEQGSAKPDALGDGWFYQVFHVQARFGRPFDVRRYPFDRQQLVIALEDTNSTTREMTYVADPGTTAIDPGLDIPGWRLRTVTAEVSESVYPTNFGDPRRPVGEDRYTRFQYTIHIERPVLGYLATTLVPISIVMLITFAVFLIPSRYFEGRLGLGITSLISAVALQLTAAGDLPKTGYLVLLDHVYNLSYLVIFVATLESVIAVRLADSDREASSKRLDRWTLALSAVLYFGAVFWLVFRSR